MDLGAAHRTKDQSFRRLGLTICERPPAGARRSNTWCASGLTWKGHEFLDTIRSPEIWRKTKDGLREIRGWSIDLARQIAKA
jgi:hypothetical protein